MYIPLEGCRTNHILGFLIGLYTAFMSLFIKPTVGMYDFLISIIDVIHTLSHTLILLFSLFKGLFNSALYEEHIMEYRSRPPRIFDNEKIVNFDYKIAIGKDILRRLKQQPKDYETIKYYDEIQVSKKKFVEIVLTDIRLVCAYVQSLSPCLSMYCHIHYIKKSSGVDF